MAEAPHFDISIEPLQTEQEFHQILETIKPLWDQNDYIFERSPIGVSTGLLNTMIKCYGKNDESDAIMIRIHNTKMNDWMDRSFEVTCIKLLAPLNCAPKILATFNNGFCYEYIHGKILTHLDLSKHPIWKLIATDFAKFHSTELDETSKQKAIEKRKEMIEDFWSKYPDELKNPKKNEIFKRELPPKEELKADVEKLRKMCENLGSPLLLCHNDTRSENIIWNEETQRIHFVDFEAMSPNQQAYEIASHFQRFCGFTPLDFALMPDEEFQMEWLRHYLEKYYEFTGKNPSDVTEKDVRKLYVQVNKYHLLLLLSNCAAGPVFEESDIIPEGLFDMLEFSFANRREYLKLKDEILALKMPD